MKHLLILPAFAMLLSACDVKVNTPPSTPVVEKNTTVVNPPSEKKVENNTTINVPPAEKKTETNTTTITNQTPDKKL